MIHLYPAKAEWPALTERNIPDDDAINRSVNDIIDTVRRNGDDALRHYAEAFDHTHIDQIEVGADERQDAARHVSDEVKAAIEVARHNIIRFHREQQPHTVDMETQPGVRCCQHALPIQRVGLYIPGGRAPLFSTVLMLALPAKIAGCPEVVMCTPQGPDGRIAPEILYAAEVCEVDHIYRIGGAQAVAAMAYGTESVSRVDKIFGPGNRYVTHAKQQLSRRVAIDMPAGPSEVLVVADDTASPAFVAADMLSQAEHGPDSQAILVCLSEDFAQRVKQEINRQTALLHRADLVRQSLSHSRIIVLASRQEMMDFSNAYAPEHLIIQTTQPWELATQVTAAGSVFVGCYSPESAGDYASGTNHTLPTGAWARSYSGVNLDSYYRKITYQELTPEGLRSLAPTIVAMAEAEGLQAHANAVKLRIQPQD